MKQYLLGMAIMVMLFSNLAQAQDAKVTVGVNSWFNRWEMVVPDMADTTKKVSIKSDASIMMIGPTLNIRYDKVFGGVLFLTSMTDYEFSRSVDVWYDDVRYGVIPARLEWSTLLPRNDLDLVGGVMFTPGFGAFVGYKIIRGEGKISAKLTTKTTPSITLGEGSIDISIENRGPGFGVRGNIPIGEAGVLYGSLAWMSLKGETKLGDRKEPGEGSGASFELGGAFKLADQLYANVGLKAQSFKGKEKDAGENNFSGITAGASYTF